MVEYIVIGKLKEDIKKKTIKESVNSSNESSIEDSCSKLSMREDATDDKYDGPTRTNPRGLDDPNKSHDTSRITNNEFDEEYIATLITEANSTLSELKDLYKDLMSVGSDLLDKDVKVYRNYKHAVSYVEECYIDLKEELTSLSSMKFEEIDPRDVSFLKGCVNRCKTCPSVVKSLLN